MSKEAKISRSAGWSAKAGMLAVFSMSLAGCGGDSLQDTLGYGKSAPDEFAIVTKAPLVIPPDYSLRPPQPGAPRPQEMEIQPALGAQRALIGDNALAEGGDGSLAGRTGAARADRRHRSRPAHPPGRECGDALAGRARQDFVDSVIFWKEPGPTPDEKLVNPAEESQRIQQNEAEGKPVTEGETPTVEQKKEGLLEGIF